MPEETRWRRDVRLPYQEIQGEAVVVVPARRESHRLDGVATFLWTALAKERTAAELAVALCEEYEVEPAEAGRDVRSFLASLEEKGLLVKS
jgi:hypothetical protein